MATAKMVLGMLAGVERPALATILPTVNRRSVAAAGCGRQCGLRSGQPGPVRGDGKHLLAERAEVINPEVGLLSIGEEDSKGNSLTRDTLPMLRELKKINFIGTSRGATCSTAMPTWRFAMALWAMWR